VTGNSSDITYREIEIGKSSPIKAAVVATEGLVDSKSINEFILNTIMLQPLENINQSQSNQGNSNQTQNNQQNNSDQKFNSKSNNNQEGSNEQSKKRKIVIIKRTRAQIKINNQTTITNPVTILKHQQMNKITQTPIIFNNHLNSNKTTTSKTARQTHPSNKSLIISKKAYCH
jgi:Bacillus/Clostridium GerA spore germination protein